MSNIRKFIFGVSENNTIQFFRYLVAGGFGWSVDILLLFLLVHYFSIHYMIAAAVGFVLGLLICYDLSVRWVFPNRYLKDPRIEFLVFALISAFGLILTEFMLWILTGKYAVHYLVTKVVATAFIFILNFYVRKYTIFKGS